MSVYRFCLCGLTVLVLLAGCTRTRYRLAADRDAHRILAEKTSRGPWFVPGDFSLLPHPASRLYDPTPPDDPWLPHPAPQLYGYELPALPPRTHSVTPETLPPPNSSAPETNDEGSAQQDLGSNGQLASDQPQATSDAVQPAAYEFVSRSLPPPEVPAGGRPSGSNDMSPASQARVARSGEVLLNPIPEDAWEAIPESCLVRMFEFEKLRAEYERSFHAPPSEADRALGRRLALEEIVYLALLNSREYQTQKEILYRTSLQLSIERYAYQLKFSPFNNGTDVNYDHLRTGGTTVNTLSVPTVFQVEKMLVTGGDLVARFANSVVMTFNGPQGFAADVSSDLFLELNQTVFQRDVRFEPLTQAERNVVYAARDFVRFRKSLFVLLSAQYYNLIRTYRQVEIDSQNYFTLVRAFHQSAAEYRAGFLPRFQLDQVEQNVLSGRSRLIATCNNLESALDNLKIRMGLPTENHVNIDMGELDQLTTRDELSVAGELVRRANRRLSEERSKQPPNRLEMLSASVVTIERMLEIFRLKEQLGEAAGDRGDLPELLLRLRVESARENAAEARKELAAALNADPPVIARLFQRTTDMIDTLLELIDRQISFAATRLSAAQLEPLRSRQTELIRRTDDLHDEWARLINETRIDLLRELLDRSTSLQTDIEMLSGDLDAVMGEPTNQATPQQLMDLTLEEASRILTRSNELLESLGVGLVPIEIDMDDAMLTAINLRFDLMNQRGDVADTWRQIKYAGDDLKSVLNLSASQRISTRRDINSPFAFTFDESETRLNASFDAPLNRRAERNIYRQSLINYQASLRQLMSLEDDIKLSVRDDLRSLALDKEQYHIEVASAALAYERVVSVLLELRLGVGRVAARDFLEAQNAYANSLSNVASRHIGYIVDRTQLFLDLELLTVGDDGFWPELYDEEFQPEPYYQLPNFALPVYGELVPGLWYSKKIQRMEHIPPGTATVRQEEPTDERESQPDAAELPAPIPPEPLDE